MIAALKRLDIHNEAQVRAYEQASYRAFLPHSNAGVRAIWIWNDKAERLKTRVPSRESGDLLSGPRRRHQYRLCARYGLQSVSIRGL